MKSIFLTIFSTKKGLEILDNEFEDDLNRKSILIFCIYGAITFLINFLKNEEPNDFIVHLFSLLLSVCFSILLGTFFAYILFKIGKQINGKASYIEVFSIFTYAFTPIIIALIMVILLKRNDFFTHSFNNPYSRNFILFFSLFFSLKILIQGLIKFNQYGIKKAILNLSPIIFLTVFPILSLYLL